MTSTDAIDSGDSDRVFQELLKRAKAEDPAAVNQLISQVQRYLYAIANDKSRNWIDSSLGPSDFVQDTLLILTRKCRDFEGPLGAWHAYARVIMINLIRDKINPAPPSGTPPVGELPDPRSGPLSTIMMKELRELLSLIRKELPPHYQMILDLRDQKLSYREIGERMQRSEEAASRLWSRAWQRVTDDATRLGLLEQVRTLATTKDSSKKT